MTEMINTGKSTAALNHNGLYLPVMVDILNISEMTQDVKLFRLRKPKRFFYSPGQFLMASVWGAGEVPISITSTDGFHDAIELCVRKVGKVTSAIHLLKENDAVGIRGPLGNRFCFEEALGRDVLFVAGGIGIAPLRSLINLVMSRREEFGKIALVYGSRNPSEVLFLDEITKWGKQGMEVRLTVDVKKGEWPYNVGIVTEFLNKEIISFKRGYAFICGPHVMISAVMRDLSFRGMPTDHVITTLEAHMKCGVGKCGHCYTGSKYICTDGPVFSYAELKKKGTSGP